MEHELNAFSSVLTIFVAILELALIWSDIKQKIGQQTLYLWLSAFSLFYLFMGNLFRADVVLIIGLGTALAAGIYQCYYLFQVIRGRISPPTGFTLIPAFLALTGPITLLILFMALWSGFS